METMMKNLEKNDMMVGVNAIILNSRNELLLAKRKNCLGDGLYSLVGGHLKKGESIEEGNYSRRSGSSLISTTLKL